VQRKALILRRRGFGRVHKDRYKELKRKRADSFGALDDPSLLYKRF